MILSAHQPCYLPSIQLFNKIALSDAFMFVGHCAYVPKSWHSHNYIRNPNGGDPIRLTVPVCHKEGQSINAAEIDGDFWRQKHLKSIKMAYMSFPHFANYYPAIEAGIMWPPTLGVLNTPLIRQICQWLKIDTKLYYSQAFAIEGHKTDMLIDMCKKVGADEFLSNEGSRLKYHYEVDLKEPPVCIGESGYIGIPEEERMAAAGITHRWQVFHQPDYGQEHPGQPLSIIDLLFRHGLKSGEIVREAGHVE